jgi:hypothetical protein
MSLQTRPRLTPDEYLALERAAETRSEFFGGEMFAMACIPIPTSLSCAENRSSPMNTGIHC